MNKKRILIVEDEAIVQVHLRKVVTELGYDVCGLASTGEEALEQADRGTPDLVLMDIRLQGDLDGIDTARELRRRRNIAVVFLTAYADEATVKRTEAVGAVGYIVKPFTPGQVRAALSTALAEHNRFQQVQHREQSLRKIVGTMSDGVLVVNREGTITFINPPATALTGWSAEQSIGRPVTDLLRVDGGAANDDASVVEGLLLHNGNANTFETETVSPDGARRTVECEIGPLEDIDGSPSGMMVALRQLRSSLDRIPSVQVPSSARRTADLPFGRGTRMLIYSHDTFGLGHLQRSLNVSRALLSRFPGLSILLVTGSAVVHRYKLPEGLDYVKLPAVRKVASEKYEARSLSMSDEGILRLRTNLLLRTIRDYDPNVVLVDHAPLGMKGEMRPALEWLREQGGSCITIAGLRDIIDDPDAVARTWNKQGIYKALESLYDHVLVYGTQSVFDPITAYGFSDVLRSKTVFMNYVSEPVDTSTQAGRHSRGAGDRPLVVVTIGGGDGAGDTVIGSYLDMLRRFRSEVDFDSLILTGPFLPPDLLSRFEREAEDLPAKITEFVPSTSPYLRRADLVVCTGGYNTLTQTLMNAKRALVIPRILHRKEQILRATKLKELGLVSILHPDDISVQRLYDDVSAQLKSGREPLTEARRRELIRFDGTTRLADFCGRLIVPCFEPLEVAHD